MKVRAKANRNVLDLPEKQARPLIRAGLFEEVDDTLGADELDALTKAELEAMAGGAEIEGTGKGGAVLKADLVKALSGTYKRRDMRAED